MQAALIMEGGYFMATTRLMPLHTGKGRTVGTAISDIIDYVQNPQKTDNGRLITSYQCDSRIADAEFLFNKRQYIAATGRVRGEDDVIAYHLRQSFVPGEITPEEANRLGCELARRFTKGKHAFIVCTHIDKKHIHNHIIFDATTLDYQRKFRNFWGSTRAVRRLNDTVKSLQAEYAELMAQKKAAYSGYRKARDEMKELLTVKANVDRIMGYEEEKQTERDHAQEQSQGRWKKRSIRTRSQLQNGAVYGGLGAAPSTSNLGSSRQRKSQVWPRWVPRGIACRFLVPRIYALSGGISSNEKRGRLHILLLIIRIFQFDGSVNDTFHNGQILLRAKL